MNRPIKDEHVTVERESCGSEKGWHVLLVEGELSRPMWECNEDRLGVHVPSCSPFICIADDPFWLWGVGHIFGESYSNPFRYFVSLDFITQGGVVSCKDWVEINSFSCEECEPLFVGELWAFRRVCEASPCCFEVDSVVLNEFKGELQLRMKDRTTNLLNRLP